MRLATLSLVLFFLIGCSNSVDRWNKNIKKEKSLKGWMPIIEQFGGKRIGFNNIYSTEKIQDGIFYIEILWVNHPSLELGKYSEEIFHCIEDCNNQLSAVINNDVEIKEINLKNLKWRKIKEDKLQPILCEIFKLFNDYQ